jgi:hypothetical protein
VSDGEITLEFSIEDVGDGIYDSAVVIDNLDFEVQQVGFTIISLPKDEQGNVQGTLSYVDPVSPDSSVVITTVPVLLPTDQVVYTPPAGKIGNPLASFEYQECELLQLSSPPAPEELKCDSASVNLIVTAVVDPPDNDCLLAGRPADCTPQSVSGGGEDGTTASTSAGASPAEIDERFPAGELVKLYARPDGEDFEFVRWGGACAGTDQITTVRLSSKTVCTATFRRKAAD